MNKYHAPSLTVSVTVHVVAVLVVFFLYKSATTLIKKAEEEKRVCISLNLCVPAVKKEVQKVGKPIKKEVEKKVKKVQKKEVVKKRKVQKKIILKPKIKTKIAVKKDSIVKKEVKQKKVISVEKKRIEVQVDKQLPIKKTVTVVKKTKQEIYINNHLKQISQILSENLYYPRRARKRGITGKVLVMFRLSKDAIVSDTNIVESKSEILSRAAIKTIQNLSGKFPKPDEIIVLQVPIVFSLR